MRHSFKTILAALAALIFLGAGLQAAQPKALLSEIKGKVQVKPVNGAWTDAKDGMAIDILTTVSTGFDSTAKILLDKNVLTVKPLTRMTVDKIVEESGKVSTTCFLRVGSVSANIKSAEGVKQDFKVMSPYSTASVRGTLFDYDGKNLVVYEGTVRYARGRPTRDIDFSAIGLSGGEGLGLEADFAGAPEGGQDDGDGVDVSAGDSYGPQDQARGRFRGNGGGGQRPPSFGTVTVTVEE
jgi:hypothetical protein